jgi:hypothetical protein
VTQPRFDGLSVLVLESRRAKELGSIVESYGGRPLIAPSMREIPSSPTPKRWRLPTRSCASSST